MPILFEHCVSPSQRGISLDQVVFIFSLHETQRISISIIQHLAKIFASVKKIIPDDLSLSLLLPSIYQNVYLRIFVFSYIHFLMLSLHLL